MAIERRLYALRAAQRLLDEQFRLPGTRIRFGWDPIIGLVPWIGDAMTAVMAGAIVIQAYQIGVSRIVLLRMLINVSIDVLIGLVPVAGDVADVFWRANSRNMQLLEDSLARPGHAGPGDWLFVGGILLALATLVVVPLVVGYLFLRALFS